VSLAVIKSRALGIRLPDALRVMPPNASAEAVTWPGAAGQVALEIRALDSSDGVWKLTSTAYAPAGDSVAGSTKGGASPAPTRRGASDGPVTKHG
jgi:hypothetical protein